MYIISTFGQNLDPTYRSIIADLPAQVEGGLKILDNLGPKCKHTIANFKLRFVLMESTLYVYCSVRKSQCIPGAPLLFLTEQYTYSGLCGLYK